MASAIGGNLRSLRLGVSATQSEVAEIAGISLEAYSRIERGLALPSYPTLVRLAASYGVHSGDLMRQGAPPTGLQDSVNTNPEAAHPRLGRQGGGIDGRRAALALELLDLARTLDEDALVALIAQVDREYKAAQSSAIDPVRPG